MVLKEQKKLCNVISVNKIEPRLLKCFFQENTELKIIFERTSSIVSK